MPASRPAQPASSRSSTAADRQRRSASRPAKAAHLGVPPWPDGRPRSRRSRGRGGKKPCGKTCRRRARRCDKQRRLARASSWAASRRRGWRWRHGPAPGRNRNGSCGRRSSCHARKQIMSSRSTGFAVRSPRARAETAIVAEDEVRRLGDRVAQRLWQLARRLRCPRVGAGGDKDGQRNGEHETHLVRCYALRGVPTQALV